MSITRHHNEWLSLVPNSGPFLSLPVLAQAFPQGLDAHDADHARRLRMAFDEWDDNQLGKRPDPGLHRAWMKFVLAETLGYDELLAEGQAIPQTLKSEVAEYGETLRPDWIVNDPTTKKARLLVQVFPRSQSLTKPVASSRWKTSPDTRMMQLLHDTGIRLGIVTNGDHWMLVNAPKNETTGYVSWYANLWLEEKDTLRAFRTLLGADRLFSVPENETIEALLDKSANDQQEVTDQLGYQVRKAVEVLIQALDKADQEHGRKLLGDVNEKVLYESALTVMMRLVFLFCAEERELLLLGDDLYDKNYAVSTLREQLRVTADQFGEEILGLRYDAWTRLLTTFRAVYAGAKHDRLKLPAYGGSLFNPDRFPFLEGRKSGTNWKNTEATPLPVSNRTVLHLLEALQVLQTKIGNTTEARKISFRALDIEQIGHVYEGLLDHTAKRATEPMLGLAGTRAKEPEIALADLEKIAAKGEKELLKFLKDESGRSESAIKKGLNAELEDQLLSRFRTASQNSDLWKRVKPFAGLVRFDDVDYPVVITTGSVFVTAGTDRRSSGTHYTPKSLTEPIVQYTLEPLVYVGPAEGLPKEQWKLRPAKELLALKICDMACGSGAFLVQVCRYLSARLLEAWDAIQKANPGMVHITPEGEPSTGTLGEMLIPDDPDERQIYALRIVAQRCIYGVDINPLAVEMAKLSLWLLTLAKDKPFEFLDHAIRCGDSLVGIHNLDQLRKFNLDGKGEDNSLFLQFLEPKINEAIALRRQITEVQANTVEDVEAQDRMLREANEKIDRLKCAADFLIAAEFTPGSAADKRAARDNAAIKVALHFNDSDLPAFRREAQKALGGQKTFHWPLEFPEVMVERGGFDAFVGNPPFYAGAWLRTLLGESCRKHLVEHIAGNRTGLRGTADLCVYFVLRGALCGNPQANIGQILSSTIAEGDSKAVGIDHLTASGRTLVKTVSRKWPGAASVEYVMLWIRFFEFLEPAFIFDVPCIHYAAATEGNTSNSEPFPLPSNKTFICKGHELQGDGFKISDDDARRLIEADVDNTEVLFPFITGESLNSSASIKPNGYVVNFGDRSEQESRRFAQPFQIIEERVKPERMRYTESTGRDKYLRTFWWLFRGYRTDIVAFSRSHPRMLACTVHTKYINLVFIDSRTVPTPSIYCFLFDGFWHFSVLQSSFHEVWASEYASSLGDTLRYIAGRCFNTFPFPKRGTPVEQVMEQSGICFYEERSRLMATHDCGLTDLYNRFHHPEEASTDIQKLRQLHIEMDNAVVAGYGWTDLDLDHGFHETKQGVRYTINEPARREVLARLLKLNHERYAEEVKQGLHEKKKGSPKKPTTNKTAAKPVKYTATLFDMQEDDE
jgi:type I restriction-modification system DNA methylase subunit